MNSDWINKILLLLALFADMLSFSSCENEGLSSDQSSSFVKFYGASGGDAGNSVIQTDDGGYIVVGYTKKFKNNQFADKDILIIKTDKYGNLEYSPVIAGTTGDDEAISILELLDGNYVITGTTYENSQHGQQLFLMKIDRQLEQIWFKFFGGIQDDVGNKVIELSSGALVAIGYTESYGNGGKDIFLVETDNEGDSLWTISHGGTGEDIGKDIKETNSGFILLGTTSSFSSGDRDIFIITTNQQGKATQLITYRKDTDDDGTSLQVSPDGGYFISGTYTDNNRNSGIYLARLSASLVVPVWEKNIDINQNTISEDMVYQGGVISIAGTANQSGQLDAVLLTLTPDGDLISETTLGESGSDQTAASIKPTSDGGYIITGLNGVNGNTMLSLTKTIGNVGLIQ